MDHGLLTDTSIAVSTSAPSSTPKAIGQMYMRKKTADGGIPYYIPYIADGIVDSSNWTIAQFPIKITTGGATPITLAIVPDYVGQIAVNDTSNTAWIALGTASAYDWALLTLTTYAPS